MDEGEKIRKIREIRGYKQEYLANQLEMSIKAYSKLERGETKLTLDRLYNIAHILKVEPEEIIHFSEDKIFANCRLSEVTNTINKAAQEKNWYEERIRHLEGEVNFLRKLLNRLSESFP